MITLGEDTVQRTRASWHKDQEINRRQGELLAKDVLATRLRLINEALAIRFGPAAITPAEARTRLHLVTDPKGVTWVTWKKRGEKRPIAVAVFTHPKTRIQGYHLICEWHWKALDNARN